MENQKKPGEKVNPKAIKEGVLNFIFREDKMEAFAKERLAICHACEHISKKVINTCKICGCIIELKVRQNTQKCPIDKW